MKMELNLQLFAEGGSSGTGAAGGTGAASGVQASQSGANAASSAGTNAKNPLANVVYGKQAQQDVSTSAAQQPETRVSASTADERQAAFEELIKGEYKEEFGKRTQQIVDARFKESKAQAERLAALQPMLDALGVKYGVDSSDVKKLMAAIEEDDSFYQEEADKNGVTVEQFKQMRKMAQENAQLREAMEQRHQQEQAASVYAAWQEQAQALQQVYSGFDLQTECRNPETGDAFIRLLRNGIDVRTAYEVIHKDELLQNAIGYAVQSTQKRTMDSIRARGMRPQENGAGGSVAAQIVKNDPSKWTKADRREVERRVLQGERIEL